jgi:hypothetical protein
VDIVKSVGRHEQQKKRELRRAEREVARQLDSATHGTYEPPERDECREKRWEMAYDDANTIRLQFLTWRKGIELTEFVVNVQVLTSEGWETIEYFDCCHGHYHLHPKSGEPADSIMRLDEVGDVQRAFVQVEQEAHDRARIIRGEGA